MEAVEKVDKDLAKEAEAESLETEKAPDEKDTK